MSKSKCIRHIKDLTLDKFITAYCDKDLSVLILDSKPSKEQLAEAWNNIITEYSKSIGGNDYTAKLKEVKRFSVFQFNVQRAIILLEVAKIESVQDNIIPSLFDFGYSLPSFNGENGKQVIEVFESLLKREMFDLKLKAKKFEGVEQREVTRDDFNSMIIEMADMFKVVVDPEKIKVDLYCQWVAKYNKRAEQIIKENTKNG